jgi:tyrosyl-tRNA synthetase
MGGSDQWGNIVAGIDLVRRVLGLGVHGLTWPLLTKADGSKFGKTASGSVWLDADKTSPYQFRQFWVQSDDAVVERYLLQFTMLGVPEIQAVMDEHRRAPERRVGQRLLAHEVTRMVHGADAAEAAEQAASILFGDEPAELAGAALDVVRAEVPHTVVPAEALADVVALLASSNGDARRSLAQGAIRANGQKLGPEDGLEGVLTSGGALLLRKGRTTYHLVEISPGRG